MAKVLLVSFSGYPYTPSSLMPDNGLAALAGCLKAAGHQPKILDYGTVSTAARLFPGRLTRMVRPLARALFQENRDLSWHEKLRFLWAGTELQKHQQRQISVIAREVADKADDYRADIVGLKLWNGDGYTGSISIARSVRSLVPDAVILGGGPHVDYFGEHILENTDAFDAVLAGEGERALPEIADAVSEEQDWHDVAGLLWRDGGEIHRNPPAPPEGNSDLPPPTHDTEN